MKSKSSWEDQLLRKIMGEQKANSITDEMREGLCYCLDKLPFVYKEIFYQKYRDEKRIISIQETVGKISIIQHEADGLRLLKSAENLNIIEYGIIEGEKRNQSVIKIIREKLNNKNYEFTSEELLHLEIKTSELPVRVKRAFVRAGVKYLHEIDCLNNPQELKGIGINYFNSIFLCSFDSR